jgi:beta-glucosidase
LLGSRNAEGRLPFTTPFSEEDLPDFAGDTETITYDRWHGWWKLERDGVAPHFPFGYGLSYTRFEWGRFAPTVSEHTIDVSGTVVNRGERSGAEIVQVYGGPTGGAASTPRRLVGFARVDVAPGETADVTVSIPCRRFSVRNSSTHQWDLASGAYALEVGRWVGDPSAQSMTVNL